MINGHQLTKETTEKLIEKISELPVACIHDVFNYIDYLRFRSQKDNDPIINVAGCLSGNSMTSPEIDAELYGGNPI